MGLRNIGRTKKKYSPNLSSISYDFENSIKGNGNNNNNSENNDSSNIKLVRKIPRFKEIMLGEYNCIGLLELFKNYSKQLEILDFIEGHVLKI
ncbi:hypothetical protein K502DRAFT_347431 [Neoconidiobolus thromboides FSU 785]|nr:hypothetical protein K502DRAFT_347431 [Neoconidiobolus thromboides FSU 785]